MSTQTHAVTDTNNVLTHSPSASVVFSGEKAGLLVSVLIVILAVLAGLALGMSQAAKAESSRAEREARMLQYYVLEMDAKLIAAGFKTDADAVAVKLKGESK